MKSSCCKLQEDSCLQKNTRKSTPTGHSSSFWWRGLHRQGISRSFLTCPKKSPDGSTIVEYCYIFECVPGVAGRNPRPTITRSAKMKLWKDFGAPDIPSDVIPCRCIKWSGLSHVYRLVQDSSESVGCTLSSQYALSLQLHCGSKTLYPKISKPWSTP